MRVYRQDTACYQLQAGVNSGCTRDRGDTRLNKLRNFYFPTLSVLYYLCNIYTHIYIYILYGAITVTSMCVYVHVHLFKLQETNN